MSYQPTFDLHIGPERRSRGGWILFWAMTALMVTLALVGNFERAADPTANVFQIETQLRQAMATKTLGVVGASSDSTRSTLEDIRTQLKPMLGEGLGPRIARLYAITSRELGDKTVPAKDIRELQYSLNPEDQFIFLAYTRGDYSQEDLLSLSDQVSTDSGGFLLAKIQIREAAGDTTYREKMLRGKLFATLAMGMSMLVAFLAGIGLWVWYAIARPKPKGFPGGIETKYDADLAAWRVCFLLLAYVLVAAIPPSLQVIRLPIFFLLLALALTMPIQGVAFRLKAVIGERKPFGKLARIGFLGEIAALPILAVTIVVALGLQKLFPNSQHPGATEVMANPTTLVVLQFFIQAVVVAPLIEEIMFRGLLAPAIAKFTNVATAIVVSSLVFAAIHPQGIAAWLSLASVGGMAAVLAYHTRSLVPSMILHAVHNGSLLILLLTFNS